MNTRLFLLYLQLGCICMVQVSPARAQQPSPLEKSFANPPASAKPWVFWYWMHGAVSQAGITADLQAMQQAGIGGAYLMPINDTSSAIPFKPAVRQLTPEWWRMVNFAMREAKRLKLQLAMHVSDGFALAGGPWIKPAQSMQKLVWTKTYVRGNTDSIQQLELPEATEGYYKDIAVFAFPANSRQVFSDTVRVPRVTTSTGINANFLCFDTQHIRETFKCDTACWIQYQYPALFTCRSIRLHTAGNNFQSHRLIIQAGDDGVHFNTIERLVPPRHGWQDTDEDYTSAIPATTARFFRFVYDKEGSEPGAEDLDAAKWKPVLRINNIFLSDEPVIQQYEAKNGSTWRIARASTSRELPQADCIPLQSLINLTGKMDSTGRLQWSAPPGNWVIIRIGHTSNGHTNATGGAARGLECDKFDPEAVTLQFNNWFGKAFEKTDPGLAKQVLKIFHVDSWECGSQNWSESFPPEFKKRRGYDLIPYLPVMAGVPVESAEESEKVLHDVRETIAELVNDKFYTTLSRLAHEKGCAFSAECVAPTMVSDGMLHFKTSDIPMGEFWLNSPSHDKPNDMLDAISGAHIYGKPLIQAEAFTSVRMNWGEHPGNLKITGDRNFALGINKMVLHVSAHNPWMDRKPGMTLDGIGVYFQRDQTWWTQGRAWIKYLQRCQYLLQQGQPVTDIALFTGEEVPRRSLLPDRLVNVLPGIVGEDRVKSEVVRLANTGTPLREKPAGVFVSANMADPADWADALHGYAYDSFNPDALLNASVKNGRIVLPGDASYAILVVPPAHAMMPDSGYMSVRIAKKIQELVEQGATILMNTNFKNGIGLKDDNAMLMSTMHNITSTMKGRLVGLPYTDNSFKSLGLEKDVDITGTTNSIAWSHRRSAATDIYFLSNQVASQQQVSCSFRIAGRQPELWDAVTGQVVDARDWHMEHGRTIVDLSLDAGASVFVLFRKTTATPESHPNAINAARRLYLGHNWQVKFDTAFGGPLAAVHFDSLDSWSAAADPKIKYYSGTAVYTKTINWQQAISGKLWLKLDSIENIATVRINGQSIGTLWTRPYRLNISGKLKRGSNILEIIVANTWANRLIGDQLVPPNQRISWTTAPFRLQHKPLLKAGLIGEVWLEWQGSKGKVD